MVQLLPAIQFVLIPSKVAVELFGKALPPRRLGLLTAEAPILMKYQPLKLLHKLSALMVLEAVLTSDNPLWLESRRDDTVITSLERVNIPRHFQ